MPPDCVLLEGLEPWLYDGALVFPAPVVMPLVPDWVAFGPFMLWLDVGALVFDASFEPDHASAAAGVPASSAANVVAVNREVLFMMLPVLCN